MNCHQNIKLHHSFIYLYQTRIVIHNTSLNIRVLTLLSSYIFKPMQCFIMQIWDSSFNVYLHVQKACFIYNLLSPIYFNIDIYLANSSYTHNCLKRGGVFNWLTHQTSNLRITSRMSSNPVKPIFP